MRLEHLNAAVSIVGTVLVLQACGGSDSATAASSESSVSSEPSASSAANDREVFTSVDEPPLTIVLAADGTVVMAMQGMGQSHGTYTRDGEKVLVNIDGQRHTFFRDGNCMEEGHDIFGKVCIGGKAGDASNVSTRTLPTTLSGSYVATNADGAFKLEFKTGNTLTLQSTVDGRTDTVNGKYETEEDKLYATVDPGYSLVFQYVNGGYEGNLNGLQTRFVKE